MPSTLKRCDLCGAQFTDKSKAQHGLYCSRTCRDRSYAGAKGRSEIGNKDARLQAVLAESSAAEIADFCRQLGPGVTPAHLTGPITNLVGQLTGLDDATRERSLRARGYDFGSAFLVWLEEN